MAKNKILGSVCEATCPEGQFLDCNNQGQVSIIEGN